MSDVDSPFGINSGVKKYIPGQKTPDTEVNESFLSSSSLSSPGGSLPIPSTIFYQDVPSYSEPEPQESPTQLFPSPSSEPVIWIDNNKKRKADTPLATSKQQRSN